LGLSFQLKRTTGELLKLEQSIKSGEIDAYVLREFRDAVDYIRKTAWAVQEWQERQVQKRDTATVIPLLVAERIRRGTQLYEALTADLKSHAIRPEAAEIEDLFPCHRASLRRIEAIELGRRRQRRRLVSERALTWAKRCAFNHVAVHCVGLAASLTLGVSRSFPRGL